MFSNIFWSTGPLLAIFGIFSLYALIYPSSGFTPTIAFGVLSLVNNLALPLTLFPIVIGSAIQGRVSAERLHKFLLSEELPPKKDNLSHSKKYTIKLKNVSLAWDKKEILQDISFTAHHNLVAVIGEVGSGKSSLIHGLLGELKTLSGTMQVNGSIAYVSQQAWLMNATLRDNILFGNAFDPEKYKNILKICELEADLVTLPAGDLTEIGERGINLSGGQKQRVALARAIYSDADIYLLDDPLSALDAHVGKAIFVNCLCNYLSKKTRVLVTHQLQYLNECDKIILLDSGRIKEIGTFEEIIASGLDIAQLMDKHKSTTKTENEDSKKEEKVENKDKEEEDGTLMTKEHRAKGSVSMTIYYEYILASGGIHIISIVFTLILLEAVCDVSANYWLSYWSSVSIYEVSNGTIPLPITIIPYVGNFGLGMWFYLLIYFSITFVALSFLGTYMFGYTRMVLTASTNIFDKMVTSVFRSPMSFFDTVPIGRILNRLGADQYSVDTYLPYALSQVGLCLVAMLSILAVISSVTPIFLVILIVLLFIYRYIHMIYISSSRELQRIKSIARSPLYSLFTELLHGVITIRAFNKTSDLINRQLGLIRKYMVPEYIIYVSNRWLGVRLEFLAAIVTFGSAFFAVLSKGEMDGGLAGLSISYSLLMGVNLNWFLRMTADLENSFVAVERCVEYMKLKPEAPEITSIKPPDNWPSQGTIKFQDLVARYRPGLPTVLNGITCSIKSAEKIGVVGRTGAGKSSLTLVLFRIIEAEQGSIIIDGIDISTIGLKDLRSKLAIIPQNPTIYTGTIRSNLDPFEEYTEIDIWQCLEAVNLSNKIKEMEGGLEAKVSEGGNKLSAGTRQLLCLARALLKRTKIIVLDEATASVDYETDELIQKTLAKEFSDATLITVAHRINTIIHYDRVMVLSNGQIAEFDSPVKLLQNESSLFYGLAKEAGINYSDHF